MKFPLSGSNVPLLTLGEKFVPGSDTNHFCKPTSVAIDDEGMFGLKSYKNIYLNTLSS